MIGVPSTNVYLPFAMDIVNNLEDDIKTVIDASVPNKIQNRAAQKMAADYFLKARAEICSGCSNGLLDEGVECTPSI